MSSLLKQKLAVSSSHSSNNTSEDIWQAWGAENWSQDDSLPDPSPLAVWQNGPDVTASSKHSHSRTAASGTAASTPSATTVATPAPVDTTGTASVPSWIASLSDPVIKSDMSAASAGGTVSEASMARLFSDLAAELQADQSTLSASQLADLHTVAANLNVGETASAYVTYVTDALIDGNAGNAEWTGGAAYASALGNLGVGTTATQLSELDGKWLLGTDLPSSTVQIDRGTPFSVSYSAVSVADFGPAGPSMNDINQGALGDCYLLSSLAEVAQQNPSVLRSMIVDNGNNTYGVRFFVNGNPEYVTVNNALANGGRVFNNAPDLWASLIEKAYTQIQASGVITGGGVYDGNSYSTIGNGGWPAKALEEITGASAITEFSAGGLSWRQYLYNDSLNYQSGIAGITTSSVLSTLVNDLSAGCDEVLTSWTNATDSAGRITLVASHALSIYGYDSATGNLEVRNPWGVETGQSWDTTFEVSLGTLLAAGDTIAVDNLHGASSAGTTVASATGSHVSAGVKPVAISDNLASASAGLNASSLSFIGSPDAITLGTNATTISYALKPGSGIETIANFQFGHDELAINMEGAADNVLRASDTTLNGVHGISIYSIADPSHGVVLLGESPSLRAASLLASHTTFSGGQAVIA